MLSARIDELDARRLTLLCSLRNEAEGEPFDLERVLELAQSYDKADSAHARAVMANLREAMLRAAAGK